MASTGVLRNVPSRTLSFVLVLALLAWVVPGAEPTSAAPQYGPDTAIVGYAVGGALQTDALADRLDAALVYDDTRLGIAVYRTADPQSFVAAAAEEPGVRYAERDPLVFPESDPNDLDYPKQWGLPAVRAPEAWDVALGSGVVVAILDTGVEWYHPDLALNMWTNDDEQAGNGIDDDGNGFVDDFIGWDFSSNDNDPQAGTCGYHGTHVSGIVAATQNNVIGVSGVAPEARVMALRMLCGGGPTLSLALQAIRYAAENGARIVSCSWHSGGATSQAFEETVTWAYEEHDMMFVKSAGNQNGGQVTYPGTLPEYIAVSSISQNQAISSFSSRGPAVELAAPGSNIYSTYGGVPGFTYASGTSMAAPHVAGIAALVWSNEPALTRDDVRMRLADTAKDLGDPGRDIVFGHGLVDAARAVGLP